jgi:hypothetical protein
MRYEQGKLAIYVGEPDCFYPHIDQFGLVLIDAAFGQPFNDCRVTCGREGTISEYIQKKDLRLVGVL